MAGSTLDEALTYPASPPGDTEETLHGVASPDPYRWLEDTEAPAVQAWTAAQNAFTDAWLARRGNRPELRRALKRSFDVGWLTAPAVTGTRVFWLERRGDADQPRLMVADLTAERVSPRVLLDVDALSGDGTVALDWFHPSPSGSRIAYGLSSSGDERSTLHVLDVASGTLHEDRIEGTRGCSLAWLPDESGFHYSRFPVAGSRYWPTVDAEAGNYHRQIYRHQLGAAPAEDARVFGEGLAPQDWPSVVASPDGQHLVIVVSLGWTDSTIYARRTDADPSAGWITVAERDQVRDTPIATDDRLFLMTDHEAGRGRLVVTTWDALGSGLFDVVIPEHSRRVMQQVVAVGDRLAVHWLEDASSVLTVHDLQGKQLREVPLGGVATVGGLDGDPAGTELLYSVESYTRPPTAMRLDLATPEATPTVLAAIPGALEPDAFEVTVHRTTSADGTPLTLFVTHRRGLQPSGDAPTVLYGYGGFNVSLTPGYTRSIQPFLDAGGVYAVAHLRGGGEYGEAWHRAGMLGKKEDVFADFEAAAAYLVDAGFTRPERLAVMGGSNGGLLTGAATVRFPGRFRAAVVRVPLLDMLRFHRFLIARLWIPEYGDPEDPEAFRWLRAYSPYHNVPAPAFDNPAVFLLTAESDTRVHPLHARKFGALLQRRSTSGRPVLLRIETRAGHGAGKPTSKIVDEYADIWTFLFAELGM